MEQSIVRPICCTGIKPPTKAEVDFAATRGVDLTDELLEEIRSSPNAIKLAAVSPHMVLTITTVPDLGVYVRSGTEGSSRRAKACKSPTEADGLIQGIVEALEPLTTRRVNRTVKGILMMLEIELDSREAKTFLLPVAIRTNNEELVSIATRLRDEAIIPRKGSLHAAFLALLNRLDIRFEVLGSQSEEIYSLRRWAALNFKGGAAAAQDGPSRRDYQLVCRTFGPQTPASFDSESGNLP